MLSFRIYCTKFKSNYNNCTGRSRVSAFDAEGLRVIRVVVQVVAEMEALRKNERHDETQFTTKIGRKISLGSSYLVL